MQFHFFSHGARTPSPKARKGQSVCAANSIMAGLAISAKHSRFLSPLYIGGVFQSSRYCHTLHNLSGIRECRGENSPLSYGFCVITRRTSSSPTSCRSPIIIHTVLRYPPKSWQNRTRAISPGFGSTGSKTPACSNRRGRRYATCAHDEKTRTHNQQRGGLSRAFSGTLQRRNIHSATGDRRYVQRYIAQDSGV